MASSFMKEKSKLITIIFCLLAIVLMISSLLIPLFTLDAEKNVAGLADVHLKADFYQYKVKFNATASVSLGVGGGMLGGILNIGGIGADRNITLEDEMLYWEGLDRFQGVVGVLYDTTKDADYLVNLKSQYSNDTLVRINTHTDIIPWWPEGMDQDITITVKLNHSDNVKHVEIERVWINVFRDWNETRREYDSLAEKAWEISPGDFLYQEGDQKVYKTQISVKRDWGDKVGFIAMVDLDILDNDNGTTTIQFNPFPSNELHPRKIINVIPIAQTKFVSVILMFVSFPLTIIAVILTILAILLTLKDSRRRKHLMFAAGFLQILAVLFFINGANTLLSLVTFLTEDDMSWNILGLLIPTIAGALLIVALLLDMKFGPKEEPKEEEIKFDISGAVTLKDEEEEVEFECPECGKEFTEMVSVCPECGAEFEGIDEEEEGKEEEEEEGEGEEEQEETEEGLEEDEKDKEDEEGDEEEPQEETEDKEKEGE